MKTHTNTYKDEIKNLGRQLDSLITYTIDGTTTTLTSEELNSITPHYEGGILKSVMKVLDIDSNVDIPIGTEVNYQFGLKVDDAEVQDFRDNYEYLDYGNYIVYSSEVQEDTHSYKIICYDKMLYAMKDYESLDITYPITVRDYIKAVCDHLGLTFKNENDEFANYDKQIQNELFLSSDGGSLNYTFRDVLNQLAEVTGSTICIDKDDKLEIRYLQDNITETNEITDSKFSITDNEEDGILGFSIEGNTEQQTYSGNQLVDFNTLIASTGLTYTFSNNVATLVGNGSATYQNARIDITNLYKESSGKTLYFTFENYTTIETGFGTRVQVNVVYSDSTPRKYIALVTENGNKQSHQIANDTSNVSSVTMSIYTTNRNVAVANTVTITKPMLQFGTETKAYEPYVGGTASPNPDYPQEVKVVKGENLFDINKYISNMGGGWSVVDSNNFNWSGTTYSSVGWFNDVYLDVPSGTYTISGNYSNSLNLSNMNTIKIRIMNADNTVKSTGFTATYNKENGEKFRLLFYKNENNSSGKSISIAETFNNVMLEESSTASPYLPYNTIGIKKQSKNLLNYYDFTTPGTTTITNETITVKNETASTISGLSLFLTGKLHQGTYTFKNFSESNSTTFVMHSSSDYSHNITANNKYTFDYDGTSYLRLISANINAGDTKTFKLQLEKGNQATSYVEHKETIYPLTLEGDNLVDLSQTQIGVAWNNSSNSARAVVYIKCEPNTKYTISYNSKGNLDGIYNFEKANMTDTSATAGVSEVTGTKTITTQSTSQYIGLQFNKSSISLNDIKATGIRIEKGSTIFPNFLGKLGNYKDRIYRTSGKNLFDKSNASQGRLYENGVLAVMSGYFTSPFIKVEPNTQYTKNSPTTDAFHRFAFYSSNTEASFISQSTNNSITTPSNCQYLRFCGIDTETNVMLNEGTTSISYEPYGTGEWYLHKEIGKVVLNGSESNWGDRPNYTYADSFVEATILTNRTPKSNDLGYSNYFVVKGVDKNEYPYVSPNGTQIVVNYKAKGTTTLADFKTWLSTHNTEVYYVLATPQEIKIEGTLEEQLEDLWDMEFYKGQTNINEISYLDFPLTLSYVTDIETIDEEYLKDINVNFGEFYGPVNSVVLSRSAGSDNVYLKDDNSIEENGLCEIKIEDNQIMNFNDRSDYLPDLLKALKGIKYCLNDYVSTGITYLELCDKYNVKIDNKKYRCIMFNDEINVTQGLEENIFADIPEETETDYTKADKTDRRIKQAYIIVDKQNQEINTVVQNLNTLQTVVNNQGEEVEALGTRITQTINNITANVTSIEEVLENGVSLVKTTSVTIDNNGINVSTDNSKISTTMSNNRFEIKSGATTLAFFGYDEEENISKSQMDNLTVTNYLISGYHRTEKFERNGERRTGYFYMG